MKRENIDDLALLVTLLPPAVQKRISELSNKEDMTEVVMDLGYKAEARFQDDIVRFDELDEVTLDDIQVVVKQIGDFNDDNRAGIERTLHRISAIRNRQGKIIGLTCRVGRAVQGTIGFIRDIIESGRNILFLGPPGIGKTTNLRETARVLADDLKKRVVIVDTSNEIGGDGDIPHHGIGTARRMQVPSSDAQHAVMIEAVQNHMPEVIIVDEIGTEAEAIASRTIAERGVQLIATAHGYTLENLIKNPTLSDLIGGIQHVILGDEEAKFRGTQKTVLERRQMPTFDTIIEIKDREMVAVYKDVASSVDDFLAGDPLSPEIRQRNQKPEPMSIETGKPDFKVTKQAERDAASLTIFPFGLNIDKLNSAIRSLDVDAKVAGTVADADIILTLQSQLRNNKKLSTITQGRQLPVHTVKRNSTTQIIDFLRRHFKLPETEDDIELEAIREIKQACQRVIEEGKMVEVAPRHAFLRRVQHNIVAEHGLNSMSIGEEPNRRVRIYPRG